MPPPHADGPAPTQREEAAYERVYVVLAGLFIAFLVSCNLIFNKFFTWAIPLPSGGTYHFQQSVGILPYPLTFLVTDILSEVYGRRRANQVVTSGLVASLFVVALVLVADHAAATEWSRVDDGTFHHVFGLQWAAVTASMAAYLAAQYLDIRFFHFWRRLTRGRHLWLRNNASTFASQVLDTVVVLVLLASLGALPWKQVEGLLVNGVLFKWLVALMDTPLIYACVHVFRRRFPRQVAAVAAAEGGQLGAPSPA